MEPTPDDDAEHAAGIRWWVPWLAGFLASGASLVALSTVFPIATAVLAGYGSAVGAAWQGRGRERPRVTRGHWAAAGFSVLMFTGLGLLLGAAGLSSDDGHREHAVPGAVIGGLLLAVSGGAVLAMAIAVRRRRRPTRSEE